MSLGFPIEHCWMVGFLAVLVIIGRSCKLKRTCHIYKLKSSQGFLVNMKNKGEKYDVGRIIWKTVDLFCLIN